MARLRCCWAICIYTAAASPATTRPPRKWLDIAAKDGHSDALFNLGAIYDKALGVDRDAPQAVKWFTLAADQRDPEAQLNLALFYIKGDGVAKDIADGRAVVASVREQRQQPRPAHPHRGQVQATVTAEA